MLLATDHRIATIRDIIRLFLILSQDDYLLIFVVLERRHPQPRLVPLAFLRRWRIMVLESEFASSLSRVRRCWLVLGRVYRLVLRRWEWQGAQTCH